MLLKKRDAQSAFEDGLERRVHIVDLLFAHPAGDVAAEHLTHDRARANDGDLDDDVVKLFGSRLGQKVDLSSALDLKHPDRVGLLQSFIDERVVF